MVLAGSTRAKSVHRQLARRIVQLLQDVGATATFADLRDFPLPLYDADLEAEHGLPANALRLKEFARRADAFVIASPEYNGSYPAVLKNAIDWISRPAAGEPALAVLRGKPAAILSATPGPHGGSRVLKQLRELLEMIHVCVLPEQLGIPDSAHAFDEAGNLMRPGDAAALQSLMQSVVRAAAPACSAAA